MSPNKRIACCLFVLREADFKVPQGAKAGARWREILQLQLLQQGT
jgi:hypothetical protein